jgi:hypothetical protein
MHGRSNLRFAASVLPQVGCREVPRSYKLMNKAAPLYWSASLAVTALCVPVGAAVTSNPDIGFLVVVVALAVCALLAPTAYWVAAALVAALTFRGLVTLDVLPSFATFADIPLAWGALFVALMKRAPRSDTAQTALWWLFALGVSVLAAFAFHPSEALRPVAYLALLGQPLALLTAILVDPPSPRFRKLLIRVTVALLILQLPLVAGQWLAGGRLDDIQGSLYGAGAGAHVISGVCAIGAIWVLSRPWPFLTRRLPFAVALLLVPFVADAKQVILALPIALIAVAARQKRLVYVMRASAALASVAVLVTFVPAGGTAVMFLNRAHDGNGGKEASARLVWARVTGDPASFAFGKGPAETVSRAAFMTTEVVDRPDSPLRILELHPSSIAREAEVRARVRSGGGSSFNSGLSSAVGVLGDLGIGGAFAYAGFIGWLFLALRRRSSAEASAAAAALAVLALLGFVFDWWEQPPFTLFVALLAGLALTPEDRGVTDAGRTRDRMPSRNSGSGR